jgi:hypothetical protein
VRDRPSPPIYQGASRPPHRRDLLHSVPFPADRPRTPPRRKAHRAACVCTEAMGEPSKELLDLPSGPEPPSFIGAALISVPTPPPSDAHLLPNSSPVGFLVIMFRVCVICRVAARRKRAAQGGGQAQGGASHRSAPQEPRYLFLLLLSAAQEIGIFTAAYACVPDCNLFV